VLTVDGKPYTVLGMTTTEPQAKFSVLYDDPTRTTGPSHSIHATGCNHLRRARDKNAAQPLKATTVDDALTEAQYQGLEPSDSSDLGPAAVAPCARKAAA
jgi:hypothetical protein